MHTAATPRARSDGLSEPSPPLKPDIRKIADAGGVRVITVAEHGDVDQVRRCRILPDRSATQASDSRNRLLKIAFDEHRVASGDPTPIIVVNASAALGDSSGLGRARAQRQRA